MATSVAFKSRGLTTSALFLCVILIYMIMHWILPKYQAENNIIERAILGVVTIAIFIKKDAMTKVYIRSIIVITIPYLLLSYFVTYPGDFKYGFLHPLLLLTELLVPAILCYIVLRRNNSIEYSVIIIGTIIAFSIVYISSWGALSQDANIMRAMTAQADVDLVMENKEKNVGAFGFSYCCGLLAITFLTLIVFPITKRINIRALLFIGFIACIVFAFNAAFATLLLLTILFCAYILYLKMENSIVTILLLFSIPVIYYCLPLILNALSEGYGNSIVGDKMARMNDAIFGSGNIEEFSGARSLDHLIAIKEWINSPLWGLNCSKGTAAYAVYVSHSTLLAMMVKVGIIGALAYYWTFWNAIKPSVSIYTSTARKHYVWPFLGFLVVLSILNPVSSPEFSWIGFMFIPVLLNYLISKYKPQYEALGN